MKTSPKTASTGRSNSTRGLALLMCATAMSATFAASDDNQSLPATAKTGTQIECTTPDGRVVAVPSATGENKETAALQTDAETLSCRLQEGQTTFVIKLPETPLSDRFTFVNENAAAAGELKISVSKDQLPAASAKWVEVGGQITFSHKRLFNVSTVGVDARYLKLSFNIAKDNRFAAAALRDSRSTVASSLGLEEKQRLGRFAEASTSAQ